MKCSNAINGSTKVHALKPSSSNHSLIKLRMSYSSSTIKIHLLLAL